MTATMPDAWMEKAFVSIAQPGGSDMQFEAMTETIDIDMGDKDVEGVPLVSGGRIVKWSPEADTSITLEAYPVEVGTDTGTVGKGFFDLLHDQTVTAPFSITNNHIRQQVRICILWTNDTSVTKATDATAVGYQAMRYVFTNAYITSVKPSFTDGTKKFKVVLKVAPYNKSGASNITMTSCAGTSGSDKLAAISAYT